MIAKGRLNVARALATFVEDEALPGTGIEPGDFWAHIPAVCCIHA